MFFSKKMKELKWISMLLVAAIFIFLGAMIYQISMFTDKNPDYVKLKNGSTKLTTNYFDMANGMSLVASISVTINAMSF